MFAHIQFIHSITGGHYGVRNYTKRNLHKIEEPTLLK